MTDATPDPIARLGAYLGRIDDGNDAPRAVIALDRDGAALAAGDSAARWRAGTPWSPIDGQPVLVKANIAVVGQPWHAGIAAYRDRVAAADAPAVARLRAKGAVILGLTNMDEGALGASGDNPWFGRIGNPRDPRFSAGGSSGGSAAAVAAGYGWAALGTDTIGSIAIPAACCGVVGHRASRALLPTAGIMPLSPTFDHGGWFARSIADALAIRAALGGPVESADHVRVAALAVDRFDLQPAIGNALAGGIEQVRRRGCTVDCVDLPVTLDELSRRMFEVAEAEAAVGHGAMLADRPDDFSPAFRRLLAWGADSGAARHDGHVAALRQVAATIRAMLTGHDALLMPALPCAGFAAGSPPPADLALFAAVPACLDWPATTIPAAGGIALLVTAPSDDICLAVAAMLG